MAPTKSAGTFSTRFYSKMMLEVVALLCTSETIQKNGYQEIVAIWVLCVPSNTHLCMYVHTHTGLTLCQSSDLNRVIKRMRSMRTINCNWQSKLVF